MRPSLHRSDVTFADLRERRVEHEATLRALDRAAAGAGMVLAFEAPAGVGKTALLRAAAAEARPRATVLTARGVELEHGLASGVVGQLFLPAVVDASAAQRAELLDGPAALAAPVLGLEPPAGSGDPVSAALHGLYWLCVNLTDRHPLVLAVDDAHWADEASLRFLGYLASRLSGLRLVLMIAARPSEPGITRAALDHLLHDDAAEIYRPSPLSPAATSTVVRNRLGRDASGDLCRACHVASGGNPFLLSELVEGLMDEHIEPSQAGAEAVEQVGPRSVAQSMLVRLARLSADAGRMARAVACFPGGAEFRHAAALAELDDAEAAQAVDQLAEVAILAHGRPLAFLHPMMQAAVYEDLPLGRRALMHLAAARLLRGEGAIPTTIATHLLATEAGSDAEAFADLLRAAELAVATGAPNAAVEYLARALAEPVPEAQRSSALHRRGIARMLIGDPAAVEDLTAAVAAAPAGTSRAAVQRDLARVLAFGMENVEAVRLLDEAIATCDDSGLALREQCEIDRAWVLFTHDDLTERFSYEMRELEVAESPVGVHQRTMSAVKSHWIAWGCQDATRAIELAQHAYDPEVFDAAGLDGVPAVSFAAVALYLADRPDEALAGVERMLERQRASGALRSLTFLYLQASMARIYAGRLADAESDLQLAVESAQGSLAHDVGGALVLACQAIVALERSGPIEAEAILEGLVASPTLGGMALHAARGRIHLAAGRAEPAFSDLQAALRAAHIRGLQHPFYMFPWGGDIALAAAALGDRGRALARADADLRLARRFGAAGTLGSALRVAGIVRGGEEGLAMLRDAVSVLESSNARLVHAQTLADLGSSLRRANQRAAARDPLRHAIDLARRCGADRLAARATEELRATGGRVRRDYVTGVESLTPSELRVARLAASGLTNREIAQQLFVTLKTVEMHVGNALAKAGVGSRRELSVSLAAADDPRT